MSGGDLIAFRHGVSAAMLIPQRAVDDRRGVPGPRDVSAL